MFLDPLNFKYDSDIIPFIKNGIIIDSSVIIIIIDGIINTRISKKKLENFSEFRKTLDFFDRIKIKNNWNKFFITPHILTEVCSYLRNIYSKNHNYKEIVEEILPILKDMGEKTVEKNRILNNINLKNPIIELGDISIFALTNDYTNSKEKVAILAQDDRLCKECIDNPKIMVMNLKNIILNLQ